MTRIAHLSDLHFGRHDPVLVEGLIARLLVLRPDLVAVSGDFTQRARRAEFTAARALLDRLTEAGIAWLAVPGNHDVPLYDLTRRMFAPLGRYRRFIADEVCPRWAGAGAVVQGLNSARRMTGKNGRVSQEQSDLVAKSFVDVSPELLRVVVTHHPLVALPWGPGGEVLKPAERADEAMAGLEAAGVHLLLAGHHHRIHAGESPATQADTRSLLVVQAGTATSTRTRDEPNSFNLIEAALPTVTVAVEAWDGTAFAEVQREQFWLREQAWQSGCL